MSREDYWDSHPGYRDADSGSARAFAGPKAARFAAWLGLHGDEPILDVGAGTGHLGEAFRRRGHPVVAVDIAQALLVRNPARARVRADAARLPFPDGSFPLCVEASLLHHVPDPVAVLREMARVGSGHVALVEPNRNHPPMMVFNLLVREEWPALRFSAGHVRRLAAKAGLRVVRLVTSGLVYQNKTPAPLARTLARLDRPCPMAAYVSALLAAR